MRGLVSTHGDGSIKLRATKIDGRKLSRRARAREFFKYVDDRPCMAKAGKLTATHPAHSPLCDRRHRRARNARPFASRKRAPEPGGKPTYRAIEFDARDDEAGVNGRSQCEPAFTPKVNRRSHPK